MKTMNKSIIFLLLVAMAFACKPADKKSELAKLKKQHDELAVKIKALETELKVGDSLKWAK